MSDRDDDFFDLFNDDDDDPFGADNDFDETDDEFAFDSSLDDIDGDSDLYAADDDFAGFDDGFGFDDDADVTFEDDEFAETAEGTSRGFIYAAIAVLVVIVLAFAAIVFIVINGRGPSADDLLRTEIAQTNSAVEVALNLTRTQNALDMFATETADAFTDTPSPSPTPSDTPSPTPDTSLTQTAEFRATLDAANEQATSVAADATATFFARLTTEPDIVPGQDIDELAQTATAIAGGSVGTSVAVQVTPDPNATGDTSAQDIVNLQATQTALEAQIGALQQQLADVQSQQQPVRDQIIAIYAPELTAIANTQNTVETVNEEDVETAVAEIEATRQFLETGASIAPQLTAIAQTLEALDSQPDAVVAAQSTAIAQQQADLQEQSAAVEIQLTAIADVLNTVQNDANAAVELQLTRLARAQSNLEAQTGAAVQAQQTAIALTLEAVQSDPQLALQIQLTQVAQAQADLEARTGDALNAQLTQIAQTLEAIQTSPDNFVQAQQTALPPTQAALEPVGAAVAQLTPFAMTQMALEQQNQALVLQLTAVVQAQVDAQSTSVAQAGNLDAIQMTETAVALLGQGGGFEATPTREGDLPTARPTVSGNAVALTATALAEILNPPAVSVTPGGVVVGTPVPTIAIGGQPPNNELPDTGLFDDVFAGNPAIIFGAALSLLAVIGLSRILRSQNRKRD